MDASPNFVIQSATKFTEFLIEEKLTEAKEL